MAAIVDQLGSDLPPDRIQTGIRVKSVQPEGVVLETGEHIEGSAVVLATEGPEAVRLLGDAGSIGSRGEWCLYFAAKASPIDGRYLVLKGDGRGWINSLTVPSTVAPCYAPAGQHLISVVVIGDRSENNATVEAAVRRELTEWFGRVVSEWRHLKTYRIVHALPEQNPPMPDPTIRSSAVKPRIYVCGEYGSVPGIQWALLSGRQTAESVLKMIHSNV
jgi:protoporphyrinogen oxidase